MDGILERLREELLAADDAKRKRIAKDVQDVLQSVEAPDDTVNRIGYLHLQTSAVRIGIELKLFNVLSESPAPKSLEDLGHSTRAHTSLLGRLLRYMSSTGIISEPSVNHFAANQITKNLSLRGTQSAICHCFEICSPMFQEFPSFLDKTEYKEVADGTSTVFQSTFNTSLTAYAWLAQHPHNLVWFNDYMASRRSVSETWLSVYHVEMDSSEGLSSEANDPVYVNMGGGIGHQCAEFTQKYPESKGRVVLQDLQQTIEDALQTPGVTNMVHDFFAPQPVLGARYYFLRGVLLNWPDDKATEILLNIIPAMNERSVIVIDESVLPDTNVHQYAASMDLNMMCALAGIQRTRSHWEALLVSAGLKIVNHVYYKPAMYEGVMEVVPVDR